MGVGGAVHWQHSRGRMMTPHEINALLNDCQRPLDDKSDKITRLQAALAKYGIHQAGCSTFGAFASTNRPCNCGFEQALKGQDDGAT